ncbi:MAG: hypothetical protein IVW57_11000 [Ktedonobacterales bacterium]|nr:hypothetical protein [Ktedonobacterales bacterium]
MRKDSYESMLRAVGQVLDHAEAQSFTIRAMDDGLRVETFDGEGNPRYTFQFGVQDLVELLAWSAREPAVPSYVRTGDEGTLETFLARHTRELVGSHG